MAISERTRRQWTIYMAYARPWLLLPALVAKRYYQDGCVNKAAALTYTTLFALVPLFTLAVSVLSFLPNSVRATEQLIDSMLSYLVPQVGDVVQSYLLTFSANTSQLTAIGLVVLLVTAVLMIHSIEQTFNQIWRVERGRRSLYAFMLYWTILTLGPILLGAALALSASLSSQSWLGGDDAAKGWLWLARLMEVAAFTLLYWAIPNFSVRFRHALVGGLLMALLFELAKRLFAGFIQAFPSYEFIYGAFVAVPLFLLWVYLSWQMILFCAQLVAVLDLGLVSESRQQSLPLALQPVHCLALLYQAFGQGRSMSEDQLRYACGLPELQQWRQVKQWLLKSWVQADQEGGWRLAKDPAQTSAHAWLETLPWRLPPLEDWPQSLAQWPQLLQTVEQTEQLQRELWQQSLADLLAAQKNQP